MKKRSGRPICMILIAAVVALLFSAASALALCESYTFGEEGTSQEVFSDGLTWEFTAEKGMWVRRVETQTGLGYVNHPRTVYAEILVNGTDVASFQQTPIRPAGQEAERSVNTAADFYLNAEDIVTYRMYGGTSETPGAVIAGENMIRLCGEVTRRIGVSMASMKENVKASMNAPDATTMGITLGQEYVWLSDMKSDRIYKYDNQAQEVDNFDAPGTGPAGLAFDGTDLWVADFSTSRIYQIDTEGIILKFFDAPGSTPSGIAFDGTDLWNTDFESGKIFKLDTAGTVLASFSTPGFGPTGITYDGENLWVADISGKIFKLNTSGDLQEVFDAPGKFPGGLCFFEGDLLHTDLDEGKIYQIDVSQPPPVTVGMSREQTITITNMSLYADEPSGDLAIGSITIESRGEPFGPSSPRFQIVENSDSVSGKTLSPGRSASFKVLFSPDSAGKEQAVIIIPSNDPNQPILEIPISATATECLVVKNDLKIDLPCVEYEGVRYQFTLFPYANPADAAGVYWKIDQDTFVQKNDGEENGDDEQNGDDVEEECLSVNEDISLDLFCVWFQGNEYQFTLDYYPNPEDVDGLYFKLDLESFGQR